MKLSVSYLSVKKRDVADVISMLDLTPVDFIHVDVMDGKYVDNKANLFSRNGIKDESNNNNYESNVIFNMTDNALNHTHTNEEKKSQKLSESIQVEELFIKQKDKIKHYKEMLERENKIIYKNDTSLNQENEQKDKEISNENEKGWN